jgi:hypothetical protein
MDYIYKVSSWKFHDGTGSRDGKTILQQMELHGRSEQLFILRFTAVWAISLNAAKAIQRQYRQDVKAGI